MHGGDDRNRAFNKIRPGRRIPTAGYLRAKRRIILLGPQPPRVGNHPSYHRAHLSRPSCAPCCPALGPDCWHLPQAHPERLRTLHRYDTPDLPDYYSAGFPVIRQAGSAGARARKRGGATTGWCVRTLDTKALIQQIFENKRPVNPETESRNVCHYSRPGLRHRFEGLRRGSRIDGEIQARIKPFYHFCTNSASSVLNKFLSWQQTNYVLCLILCTEELSFNETQP